MNRPFYAVIAVVCIVLVLGAVNLHRDQKGTGETTKAEFSNINAELGKLTNELAPLQEELAGHKNNLTIAVEVIEKNRGGKDETEVTTPNGTVVTLLTVRRDTNIRLQKMESLQREIVQKEARISELKKRGGEILSGISGRQQDEKIPPDVELLKRAGHLLDSQAIAAPAAAK